jgi:hypothetical protein
VFTNDVLSVSDLLWIPFDFGGILSVIRSSMLSQGSMKDRGEFLGAICHKSRALCYSSAGHDDTRSRTFSTRHGDTQSQRFASSAGQGDVLAGGGKRTATSKSWAQGRASACDLVGVEAERTAPRLPGQQTRSPALGR